MSSPLPLRPSIDHTPRPRSVIALADEDSAPIFEALGSETARSILTTLAEQPATATDLADTVGTSVQNVQYHIEKLRDADLIAEVGTWYSSKGKEMRVYAPMSERVELRIASEHDTIQTTGQGQSDAEDSPDKQAQPFVT